MNFQYLAPIDSGKALLDMAFKKAREKSNAKPISGEWLQIIRQKESVKLDIVKDVLVSRLDKILKSFPTTKGLPDFYLKLMELTLDYPGYKKSLGGVNWAIGKIRLLQKDYVSKISHAREKNTIKKVSAEFYGRVSSVIKQVEKNLQYLGECRRIMRTYPDIKEIFTVCIYGFPNVGKSTLLNKLTGSKAEVAAYAFTTKIINSGFFKIGDKKIQVLDVPGTLNRQEKMNNIELQADLVVKELANIIVYVFDISEYCGYSFKKQEQLYKNLGRGKKVLIYLSKKDMLDEDTIAGFKHKHYSIEEIQEKIASFVPKEVPVVKKEEEILPEE